MPSCATCSRTHASPEEFEAQPHFGASRLAAVRVGVALFAVNPMAVYAVAYLVQRSIVMATFFAVLACWCFVRGLSGRGAAWYAGAVVAYAAAVLSKEHAVMVAAMAVPLYIHVKRPAWRTVAAVAGVAALLVAVAAAVLFSFYGDLIGKVFDQRSIDLTRQLELLSPGITQRMYPLSILNEAALFFAYGLLWFVPNVMWMSVDLHPAFPLSFTAFPQVLGLLGYVAPVGRGGMGRAAPPRPSASRALPCCSPWCCISPNSPRSGCRIRSSSTEATSGLSRSPS